MGEYRAVRQSGRRVTVDEAARLLGLSVDAVRKRAQRDQIAYEKAQADEFPMNSEGVRLFFAAFASRERTSENPLSRHLGA